MKTKYLMIFALVGLLSAGGCKTNENNYREAYLKAKEQSTNPSDSTELQTSLGPKLMKIGDTQLPAITQFVALSKEAGNPEGATLSRYGVVVGKFKQIFNAKSMRERLAAQGYPAALVVYNGSQEYYVVACSTSVANEVGELLEKVHKDDTLTLRTPFPYILRSASQIR